MSCRPFIASAISSCKIYTETAAKPANNEGVTRLEELPWMRIVILLRTRYGQPAQQNYVHIGEIVCNGHGNIAGTRTLQILALKQGKSLKKTLREVRLTAAKALAMQILQMRWWASNMIFELATGSGPYIDRVF